MPMSRWEIKTTKEEIFFRVASRIPRLNELFRIKMLNTKDIMACLLLGHPPNCANALFSELVG
jgi:hypothetical protein